MEKEISTDNLIEKINTYCDIVTEFSKLLETENEALRVYDVEKIAQLYDQKTHIVGAYRSIVAFFIKNQTLLSNIELSYREKMKTLAAGLDKLMKENDLLLKTKMQTSQSVMDSFVGIAKTVRNSNATSYGAGGKYSNVDNAQSAIALNKTF